MKTIVKKEDIKIGFTYLATGSTFTFKVVERSMYDEDRWRIVNITPGFEGEGSWQSTKTIMNCVLRVIEKQGEIIGYETVVDLPGIPKGTKSINIQKSNHYNFPHNTFNLEQLKDTRFFKPIYKQEQLVVDISGDRQVGIKNEEIVMIGDANLFGEAISISQFLQVYKFITSSSSFNTKIKRYNLDILTFKLGCVELTREDISKIYEAIAPQLKGDS